MKDFFVWMIETHGAWTTIGWIIGTAAVPLAVLAAIVIPAAAIKSKRSGK